MERTEKKYKALQLAGVFILLLSVVARIGTGDYWWTGAGVVGVLLYAAGRIGAWWRHG